VDIKHEELKHVGDAVATTTGIGAWLMHNAQVFSELLTGLAALVTIIYWCIRTYFLIKHKGERAEE
jgi:hypothetical protein